MPRDFLINDASFPGASGVIACTYTVSHGISPGRAVLTCGPSPFTAEVGDLVLSDGRTAITLRQCKVVQPSYSAAGGPQAETLVIEDRRWKWRMAPPLFGLYNQIFHPYELIAPVSTPNQPVANAPQEPPPPPSREEPIWPKTRRTAPELAKLCLRAMGETNYDLSGLDPTATPPVNWDGTNPAQALAMLAEQLGCRVVYQPVADRVVVAPIGTGADLPAGPELEDAPAVAVPARPEKVVLYGERVRVQQRFALEAVGRDFDGRFNVLDNLSYRPKAPLDWSKVQPPGFGNLPGPTVPGGAGQDQLPGRRTKFDAMSVAAQTVYRCYRLKLTGADGTGKLTVPPFDPKKPPPKLPFPPIVIDDLRKIRLMAFRLVCTTDDVKRRVQLPAACYGRHNDDRSLLIALNQLTTYQNSTVATEVKSPFSVDPDQNVVTFANYVYGLRDGGVHPGELVIECAAEIADPATFQWLRSRHELPVAGGMPGEVWTVVNPDVRYEVITLYGVPPGELPRLGEDQTTRFLQPAGVSDNAREIAGRARYYMAGELVNFAPDDISRRTYPGLQAIDPDGAVQQVTWSIGADGPRTQASRNTEHASYLPSYRERRGQELGALVDFRKSPDWVERKVAESNKDIFARTGHF